MKFNPDCRSCRRLTHYLRSVKQQYPEYHCAPVDALGSGGARLLVVGLAPGLHGANKTGRPFTGDASGALLFATLHRFGFASAASSVNRDDGLALHDCRITNAVRCLPPGNRPSSAELKRCGRFLAEDLMSLPASGVVVALGRQAHDSVIRVLGLCLAHFPFAHGAEHQLEDNRLLIDSYHCSRYNTQTGRLSLAMFNSVFIRVTEYLRAGAA